MAPRVVDPTRFLLLASVVDWTLAYRRDIEHVPPPQKVAADRGLKGSRLVQLRWVTDPALGYPTEPFTVWRRGSAPAQNEAPIPYGTADFMGATLIVFDRPRVFVRAGLQGPAGYVIAFAGAPYASPMISPQTLSTAQTQYAFSAPAIQCLLISPGVVLTGLSGLDGDAAQDLDWQKIEIVGLPVDQTFNNVLNLDEQQGLVGAPQDPPDAALDRFRRGAPFYGWRPLLDTGSLAPAWRARRPEGNVEGGRRELAAPAAADGERARRAAGRVHHDAEPRLAEPQRPDGDDQPAQNARVRRRDRPARVADRRLRHGLRGAGR